MYINTSFKYHRATCFLTKVHDLLGQPSYVIILHGACKYTCIENTAVLDL